MSTYVSPTDVSAATLIRSATTNDLDAATGNAFALLPDDVRMKHGTVTYAVDTGVANAYVVILAAAPTGYVDGLTLAFKATAANTGSSSINVNVLGVKAIGRPDGTALIANDIVAGQVCTIAYSTTSGMFQLVWTGGNAQAAAAAVSAAASAASAVTATNAANTIDGTTALAILTFIGF